MKIYRHWASLEIEKSGIVYHFKAGSNESEADALRKVKKKVDTFQRYRSGELTASAPSEDYEAPICEELVQTLDEHNVITRNRYGALVLNSENLLFLDIDDAPLSFSAWLGSLFGGSKKSVKERILEKITSIATRPEFQNTGFRVYETCRGIRLLFSLSAKEWIESGKIVDLARLFGADKLYAQLCVKQHCCRARLTPKPARLNMRTMLKFKFPYNEKLQKDIDKWLREYQHKSEENNVCRLLKQLGPDFTNPVIEYHDKMSGVNGELPLA